MKRVLKTFERLFVIYFSSMLVSVLIGVLLNIPLKLIIKNYNELTSFIVGIISAIITMAILSFIDGSRVKKYEFKYLILSSAILLVLLIIITSIIGRAVYISGPTNYLAHYIVDMVEKSLISEKILLNRCCLVLMIIAYIFLYTPIILIAEYLGVKKRIKYKV